MGHKLIKWRTWNWNFEVGSFLSGMDNLLKIKCCTLSTYVDLSITVSVFPSSAMVMIIL